MRCAMWIGGATLVALFLATSATAGALKVFPVRVELTPDEPVQTMTIENGGGEPARVQLRVYAWRQQDGKDVFEETRDVLANPPLFEVGPGGAQIARFGLRVSTGEIEKSYRVFLEEIPTDRPSLPGEVRTLLRISIPIFVPAPDATARAVWRAWSAGARQTTVAIRNDGKAHIQINRLTLSRKNGERLGEQAMSVYLLPGSEQHVTLDTSEAVRQGEALSLEAATDQGTLTLDLVGEAMSDETGRP